MAKESENADCTYKSNGKLHYRGCKWGRFLEIREIGVLEKPLQTNKQERTCATMVRKLLLQI